MAALAADRLWRRAPARHLHLLWVSSAVLSVLLPVATVTRVEWPRPEPAAALVEAASASPVPVG